MPIFGMRSYNGAIQRNPRMKPPPDQDRTPTEYRRYVNNGAMEVQLFNGLRNQIARGVRFPYRGAGWFYGQRAIIPGLSRDQAGGYAPRNGMDPWSIQTLNQMGPGSQPAAPGFPRMVSGIVESPMSG